MATLQTLPNEILIVIAAHLFKVGDLAALSLTDRRLCSVARGGLYAAAARDDGTAKAALFHATENGSIEAARSLLAHGVDPSPVYVSPIPRDCLHRVLAAQGRRPERRPLVDRKLALETVAATLRGADQCSELPTGYHRLQSALLGEIRVTDDRGFYSRLHFQMQTVSKRFDSESDAGTPGTETHGFGPASQLMCDDDDDWYKWTPLHVAAQRGDDELVTLLLDSGAAVDSLLRVAEDPTGRDISDALVFSPPLPSAPKSPLHLAIAGGHESTARLLLTRGASTAVSPGAVTVLHLAAWHGALGVCRSLVDEHAHPVDAPTSFRLTPFQYAAAAGHLQTVCQFLRERGADVHACFEGAGVLGLCVPEWTAFTHALYTRRYADAWVLLSMDPDFTVPREKEIDPVEACLGSANISWSDEHELVPMLRHLLSRQDDSTTFTKLPLYLDVASGEHLTNTVKLLLEVAKTSSLSPYPGFDSWLESALGDPRSNAAIDTVMALVDYGVSELGRPTPALREVFPPTHSSSWAGDVPCFPVNLRLMEEGALEARLQIAKLLHQRLAETPQGVDDMDLRDALLGACQPGGLPACEWLATQGALRRVGKSDLVRMLDRTTRPRYDGGDDAELAHWVLTQADNLGNKGQVLDEMSVPRMILRHGTLETAVVLGGHGAKLGLALDTGAGRGNLFSCQTRQRIHVPLPSDDLRNADCVFLMLFGRPDTAGAVDFLRLALDAAGEGAGELVNCKLKMPPPSLGQIFTPASLLCCINIPTMIPKTLLSQEDGDTPKLGGTSSESVRLAMLKMLLDAGAEVRTLVEANGGDGEDDAKPSEPLWQALASEDEHEMSRQQQQQTPSTTASGPTTVWGVVDWQHDPVRCAIWSRMPTLVQAMLEARPLPTKNHPAALRYLHAACGGTRLETLERPSEGLSPQILGIVLRMAKLDHADLPLGPKSETALMALLRFYNTADLDVPAPIHECRCEPDLVGSEKDDLRSMVKLLLAHGAKWQTRCPSTGRTALDELRGLMSQKMRCYGIYKQHNRAELRKHIVLDLYSEAAHSAEGFNPFEMGDIKATKGGSGRLFLCTFQS